MTAWQASGRPVPAPTASRGWVMTIGLNLSVPLSALLLTVFVAAVASAQNDPDRQAVADYRLTAENLTKVFAIDSSLKTMASQPLPSGQSAPGIDASIRRLEGMPEVMSLLDRHHLSVRDYLLTVMTALFTDMVSELLESGRMDRAPTSSIKENVELWRTLPPDVKIAAREWKQTHANERGR